MLAHKEPQPLSVLEEQFNGIEGQQRITVFKDTEVWLNPETNCPYKWMSIYSPDDTIS